MACLQCCCSSSSSSSSSVPHPPGPVIEFEPRPARLASIERSQEHRLTLLNWKAELTASSNQLASRLSHRNEVTSHVYQILGLFFVFEGVIITAVTQLASTRECHMNSWLMFVTLSTLASVATFLACIQKLKEIKETERFCSMEKAFQRALYGSIERLQEEGTRFDLVRGQPAAVMMGWEVTGEFSVGRFWKVWVCSYAGAVLLVLLAFSGVFVAAIRLILCDPHRSS